MSTHSPTTLDLIDHPTNECSRSSCCLAEWRYPSSAWRLGRNHSYNVSSRHQFCAGGGKQTRWVPARFFLKLGIALAVVQQVLKGPMKALGDAIRYGSDRD
jgi:hypothetical protein